jgi:hypothetical protein
MRPQSFFNYITPHKPTEKKIYLKNFENKELTQIHHESLLLADLGQTKMAALNGASSVSKEP